MKLIPRLYLYLKYLAAMVFFTLFIFIQVLSFVWLIKTISLVSPHLLCTQEGITKAPPLKKYGIKTADYGTKVCTDREFRLFKEIPYE
jgi:hypothetical protein